MISFPMKNGYFIGGIAHFQTQPYDWGNITIQKNTSYFRVPSGYRYQGFDPSPGIDRGVKQQLLWSNTMLVLKAFVLGEPTF